MPQNKDSGSPPKTMTWAKASPILIVAALFDALRIFFEFFWFFGPALAAVYCTNTVNSAVGASVAGVAGKVVATACAAGATVVGGAAFPITGAFGTIMAMAVGLLGWMVIGLWLVMTNPRIFKENTGNLLWFVAGLMVSEIPFIGTVPSFSIALVKMYRTQIKKDAVALQTYEKARSEEQNRVREQQAAQLMQYRDAQTAQTQEQEAANDAQYEEEAAEEEAEKIGIKTANEDEHIPQYMDKAM